MAQYVVEPSTLLPWLPRGLELDFFRIGSERYAEENRTFGIATLYIGTKPQAQG